MKPTADQTNESEHPVPPRARSRRDVGSTYVELLVSIVLLGTSCVAVLTAVAATARGASVHRDVTEVQSQLSAGADLLMSTDSGYKSCAHPDYVVDPDGDPATDNNVVDSDAARAALIAYYDAQVATTLPAYASSLSVIDIQFWNFGNELGDPILMWADDCRALDQGERLQRLTLAVSGTDVAVTTINVVKRPPNTDVPTVGVVESPPFGSGGPGSGSGSGSFVPNPCLSGGCMP